MRVIFWDRCWVVHIPFVCMVEFKFSAHDLLVLLLFFFSFYQQL